MASAYIEGHRGRTFVLLAPGEVTSQRELLDSFLEDIVLLHGLGVRLVLVLGAQQRIDAALERQGLKPRYAGGYRVTDAAAQAAAVEAAGGTRMQVEAALSRALSVGVVRRHARGAEGEDLHYGPAVRVASGNWVTGRRRGVVDGIDFGATGSVRFMQAEAIEQQLDMGSVVLLSSLAYSAAGEVLNCNAHEVATHAAVELHADKLIILTLDAVADLGLPHWLPLNDAEELMAAHMARAAAAGEPVPLGVCRVGNLLPSASGIAVRPDSGSAPLPELQLDLDCWQSLRFPNSLLAAVAACKNGVRRAHLVDARADGGLLLELYSRDGAGTMISTDFYEGIRPAAPRDLKSIEQLLAPLEREGVTRKRSREELAASLPGFTVVERESKVLGCALLQDLGEAPDGPRCGELAAFCVSPAYRGSGRGDALLDYVEQSARDQGMRRLVLLTTRTADWFQQRDFVPAGPAHLSELLPEKRRATVDPKRNSQLYVKTIYELDDSAPRAGKRIGF
ncbi:hypothetical protein WJX81_007316 [Elliptochloris bilobata]|uniref:amino-acid N-acetyltransferase n=1 Tax=Elliptochloris bilobata TaxID=381761 RepID=A0AAW1QIW9_9CHLO